MSYLKKEFQKNDINRIRNLISGKENNSTRHISGHTKKHIKHVEGDVWEENGKTWTITNGVKININTRQKIIREAFHHRDFCPKCSKLIKHPFDKKMMNIHNLCFDCVIDFEAKLKREGKYEEYEKKLMTKNAEIILNDLTEGIDEFIDDMISSVDTITEQGDIERWSDIDVDTSELKKKYKEYFENIKKEVLK